MKYLIRYTKSFKKDFLKAKMQEKNLKKLKDVVSKLSSGDKLDKSLRNHRLIGDYKDCMECHLEPDWLLIYRITGNELILVRTGSHSELFR